MDFNDAAPILGESCNVPGMRLACTTLQTECPTSVKGGFDTHLLSLRSKGHRSTSNQLERNLHILSNQ